MSYEVIVLGAGHNGLVAAARLARQGRKVLVLDQAASVGGLCAAREFHPGYRIPGILHETNCFSTAVARQLDLARHGLEFREDATVTAFGPDGEYLSLHRDGISHANGEPAEAEGFHNWKTLVERVRPFVLALVEKAPPKLDFSEMSNLIELGLKGLGLRRLGKKWMLELIRIAPMSAGDWLSEYFRSPAVIEALSFPGILGSYVGPRAAGTAANLLVAECARGPSIKGGPARLVEALQKACQSAGVEIRTESEVEGISLEGGRVRGVGLAGGQVIEGAAVVAAMDPKAVFLRLIPPRFLSLKTERQFLSVRTRGVAAKLHLALSTTPKLGSGLGPTPESLRIGGGHPDFLERAFDAIKYGSYSEEPHLEVLIPTLSDPELAPAGHHVLSAIVHCAPYELKQGWADSTRKDFTEAVVKRLERVLPEIRGQVISSELLTPADLEREYGCSGGHLFHGELALDQLLFMRPTPETSGYRTPIQGLFLAGSGSHPGGGITGLPGWLGAEAVLRG